MRSRFTLFLGFFLQLMGAVAFQLDNFIFGISISVLGITIVMISIASFSLKVPHIIYFSLVSLFYLVIIAIDGLLNLLSVNYLLVIALIALTMIQTPFSILKQRAKVKIIEKKIKPKPSKVVALKNGKVYHRPNCPLIQRTKKKDLIIFDNAKQARQKKLKPCKMCLPQ